MKNSLTKSGIVLEMSLKVVKTKIVWISQRNLIIYASVLNKYLLM